MKTLRTGDVQRNEHFGVSFNRLICCGSLVGDGGKVGEANLELPVAPAEPTDAVAGHAELRRDSIDSTETDGGSHRRSASGESSSSGDDIPVQYVDPFADIAASNQLPSMKAREQVDYQNLQAELWLRLIIMTTLRNHNNRFHLFRLSHQIRTLKY